MPWVRVESAVSRHRKFIEAGPAACWLWFCGLAYCQEGLTDGFIPSAALDYLGCRNAKALVGQLVSSRLWDVVDGGWVVHDYLAHNKSAQEVGEIRSRRAKGGGKGGRPKEEKPSGETLKVNHAQTLEVNLPENLSPFVDVDVAVQASSSQIKETPDRAFARFRDAYPAARRKGGPLVEQTFLRALAVAGLPALLAALENHIASGQWSNPNLIPSMDKWLAEERWRQTLPEAGAASASQQNSRTAGNRAALERFIARGSQVTGGAQ